MMMQWKRWAAAGLVVSLLAAAPWYGSAAIEAVKGGSAMAAGTEAVDNAAARIISVTGEGKLTIQPDVAYVSFGVFTKAKTAQEAQAANAKEFAAVKKVLIERFNVAEKDIKTNGFSVHPEYTYPQNSQPQITGYTANHHVVVTYRKLDGIGALLDGVSQAGANRVNGVTFDTEKGGQYELEAIKEAMANAEGKAKVIADYAKRDLKGIVHVQQSGVISSPPIPYPMAKVSFAAAESAADTSIQPGELEFTTTISVTFEM